MATASFLFENPPHLTPNSEASETEDAPEAENPGLCVTCNHRPHCAFKQSSDTVVHQCEEFDGESPRLIAPPHVEAGAPEEAPDPFRYNGLCVNCDHRSGCMHARATGGVWTCEEYA